MCYQKSIPGLCIKKKKKKKKNTVEYSTCYITQKEGYVFIPADQHRYFCSKEPDETARNEPAQQDLHILPF